MNYSKIASTVERNKRECDQALRAIENDLSNAHEQTLRLEHQIICGLQNIAALQLDYTPTLSLEVKHTLNARLTAEADARSRLAVTEDSIADLIRSENLLQDQMASLDADAFRALEADPGYVDVTNSMDRAKKIQSAGSNGHLEIREECMTKLAEFSKNPVYRYLVLAGFGTEEYASTGLIRFLDSWAAKQVNFIDNRANELTLLSMQKANESLQDEQLQAIVSLESKHHDLVSKARAAVGFDQLAVRHDAMLSQIGTAKNKAKSIKAELKAFADKDDPHFKRAAEIITQQLKAYSPAELLEQVKLTPDENDNLIADKVIGYQAAVTANKMHIANLESKRADAKKLQHRAKELESSLSTGYYRDSDYRYRDSLDVDSLVIGWMAGTLTQDSIEREVRSAREEIPQTYSPSPSPASRDDDYNDIGGGSFFSSNDTGGESFSTTDSF